MGKKKNRCKLCNVKRKEWEDINFFGINCRKHFVPMIVLKEHKDNITKQEKEEIKKLSKKYYPRLFPGTENNCLNSHFNVHLTKKNSGDF